MKHKDEKKSYNFSKVHDMDIFDASSQFTEIKKETIVGAVLTSTKRVKPKLCNKTYYVFKLPSP